MDARALTSKAETAFQTGDVGNGLVLGDRTELMSALGHRRTSAHVRVMSALPPRADITAAQTNVCIVPKADIRVDCSIRKEEPPDVVRGSLFKCCRTVSGIDS